MKKSKSTTKNTAKTPSKRAKPGQLVRAAVPGSPAIVDEASLLTELRNLIQAARQRTHLAAEDETEVIEAKQFRSQ